MIHFERYPQILIYPKPEPTKTRKSKVYDTDVHMTFETLLMWILSSLGIGFSDQNGSSLQKLQNDFQFSQELK